MTENSAATTLWERVPPARSQLVISLATVAIAACALFARLGHYALWDDEASTALIGEGVWQTGDTSAVVGRNIVAYCGGTELSDRKERYLPPLQYYAAAPFTGFWPGSALAARFPFAVVGLLAVGLILWWLHADNARLLTWLLTAMALIGNVSFWLYCRQCRYYSLAIFFSLAMAFLYLHWKPRSWAAPLLALASIGLLASNYLNFAALYAALGLDWLIWGRTRIRVCRRDLLWLLLPQIAAGLLIIGTWNPLGKSFIHVTDESSGIVNRVTLFLWYFRDMNRCEFGALAILIAALILSLIRGNQRVLQALTALVAYVLAMSLLSPEKCLILVHQVWHQITFASNVRYLAPVIPLMIAIGVLFIRTIRPAWLAILLGLLAFGTNVLDGGPSAPPDDPPSAHPVALCTPLRYAIELIHPPPDPYSAASDWIDRNMSDGQSVYVLPGHMAYPLMYRSPQVVYAWQLSDPPQSQWEGLPSIHFAGRALPDFVICFGPENELSRLPDVLASGTGADLVATLDSFGRDQFRPELFWHMFSPVRTFDRETDAIYVLKPRAAKAARRAESRVEKVEGRELKVAAQ